MNRDIYLDATRLVHAAE